MFALVAWALLALSCAGLVASQEPGTGYDFTMSVTSPAPVPGQPFALTWTGGQPSEVVYIILNYYFPDTPNQNIIYITTDILSNAPNNGSWTYDIPSNIEPGRYSFSIGENPLLASATSGIFTITASQISGSPALPGPPATTNTAYQSYNGCGLIPLPDFTYTGYQPPCTTTSNGIVKTIYPIVPASDSSAFFGSSYLVAATATDAIVTVPSSTQVSSSSYLTPFNTAFATGVYAQALQCPTPVTPSTTKMTVGGATTIFSLVGCATAPTSSSNSGGVCHTSGYTTFSVSGTSSVCCPGGWATTPLNSELFCFTSMGQAEKRAVEERQASTEILGENASSTLVEISGLAFTSAGIVTGEAAVETGSSSTGMGSVSTTSGSHSTMSISTATSTGSAATASTTKSDGLKLVLGLWKLLGMAVVAVMSSYVA